MDRFEGLEGKTVKVTPRSGKPYTATVRSVHEDGVTVWLDAKKEDEGEVRTVVAVGKFKAADIEVA